MRHPKIVLTAGFAMFSMFFGSGNLVFPLLVGKESLHQYPLAIFGFMVTAVLVPFHLLLSSGQIRHKALPSMPARAVRPMR